MWVRNCVSHNQLANIVVFKKGDEFVFIHHLNLIGADSADATEILVGIFVIHIHSLFIADSRLLVQTCVKEITEFVTTSCNLVHSLISL